MLASQKGRHSFSLGAPSWVLPLEEDNFLANVSFLAPLVDRVQILCFEKDSVDELFSSADLTRLRALKDRHGLAYTVHLPSDLGLLDPRAREEGLSVIRRIRDLASPLEADAWILHLDHGNGRPSTGAFGSGAPAAGTLAPGAAGPGAPEAASCLAALAAAWPGPPGQLHIENTHHDISPLLPGLRDHGFGLCLDLGHHAALGLDPLDLLHKAGDLVKTLHLQGFQAGQGSIGGQSSPGDGGFRDHLPLDHLPLGLQDAMARFLKGWTGHLIMELFHADWWFQSAEVLAGWFTPQTSTAHHHTKGDTHE